jgi:hypothetical protein
MDIKSGQAESHETPLPIDTSATPGVAPQPTRFPSETGRDGSQGGVRDLAGERLSQLDASAADAAAAMHAGMAADADRRGRYATGMSPLGASYGDALPVVEYGASGATVAGSWFDPPRSGTPADTA